MDMDSSDSKPAVKSADRVLDLFELLALWGRPMSHMEISEQLGIPKSSLTNLLQTLIHRGYLSFGRIDRTYALGPSVVALASQQSRMRGLQDMARPVLEELTRQTGESSALNMLRGDESVVVATVLGPHRLVSHMREGDAAPLYATSGGKVLLAYLPEGMRREYLERVLFEGLLPGTIRTASALRKEIDKVRSQGFATVVEEFSEGVAGMAVPVRAPGSFLDAPALGAVNIAMPLLRWNKSKQAQLIDALRKEVALLERRLRPVSG
jgi:DNA-binding IclR family transcriptional regulator